MQACKFLLLETLVLLWHRLQSSVLIEQVLFEAGNFVSPLDSPGWTLMGSAENWLPFPIL